MRPFPGIDITPGAYIALALALLLLPLPWLFAAIFAGLLHELGHIFAVKLCGGDILRIRVSPSGAQIQASPLDRRQGILCSLAGPLFALCTLFLARVFPRLAICACIQSIYNLLPLYPLDGGQVLHRLANRKVCGVIEWSFLALLLLCGLYSTFVLRLGLMPLLLSSLPLFQKNTLQSGKERGTIVLPKDSEVRL